MAVDMTSSWLGTVSGRSVDFLNPDPDSLSIHDIARGLANTCRFSGQVEAFYSVAQHSVMASSHAREDHKLTALLHDSPEAYMGDCPRPLKVTINQLHGDWAAIEDRLYRTIASKFGALEKIPAEVKEIDNRLLFTERRDLQPRHCDWGWEIEPYEEHILPWAPSHAYFAFLDAFYKLKIKEEFRAERTALAAG